MKKYSVTIHRTESFTVLAESEEEAVELAFENAMPIGDAPDDQPETILEHGLDTTGHDVDEMEEEAP